VSLTAKGRRAFKALWVNSKPLRARLLAAFRPDEVTDLVGLLHRVAEVLAPPTGNGRRATKTKIGPGS
jgi:DNA-binding MarR family transcriptional regulator